MAVAVFFYIFTKGALVLRGLRAGPRGPADHVYPVYSEMWLMRLVDVQPVISAILLFQYGRLVSWITEGLRQLPPLGEQLHCALGDATAMNLPTGSVAANVLFSCCTSWMPT